MLPIQIARPTGRLCCNHWQWHSRSATTSFTRRYTADASQNTSTASPGHQSQRPQAPRPATFTHPRRPTRELPRIERQWPVLLATVVVGVTGWAAFYFFATNEEKVSSSVVQQVMKTLREDPGVDAFLGDAIRPEPAWYLNGSPLINGNIAQLQGNIDIAFRVKGHKNSGTLYFTSIRKAKGDPFQILRFRLIGDDGTVLNIPTTL